MDTDRPMTIWIGVLLFGIVVLGYGKGGYAYAYIFARGQQSFGTSYEGGSGGENIINEQNVFALESFWVAHLEYARHVLPPFEIGALGLVGVVAHTHQVV